MNAAKREAFFKGGENAGPKFDPSQRFVSDRERIPREPHGGHTLKDADEREKDYSREKKYGESTKELDGYVGFANLPNQVYRKSVKRGFEFTLMVVGRLTLWLIKVSCCLNCTHKIPLEWLAPLTIKVWGSEIVDRLISIDKAIQVLILTNCSEESLIHYLWN